MAVQIWRFLGEPVIPGPSGDLTGNLGKKHVALLAYLALHADGVSRDEAADLLWPGPEPSRALHSLRQCLFHLRKAFGDGQGNPLDVSDSRIALDLSRISIDALRIDEIAASDSVLAEELLDLCRGPFLQGFVTRARPFDDWAALQRHRLANVAAQALILALDQANHAGHRSVAARITAVLAELQANPDVMPLVQASVKAPVFSGVGRPRRWRRTVLYATTAILLTGAVLSGAYVMSLDARTVIDEAIAMIFPEPAPPSIAVMPFVPRTLSDEATYLAHGLTSNVTNALYAVTAKDLFVVTAVWDAQELAGKRPTEISRILGVRYLMAGEIAVYGDSLHVDVKLLDGETGVVRWSDKMVARMQDISDLEHAVTLKILKGLDIDLSRSERNRIKLIDDTRSLDAWIAATKGLSHLIRLTEGHVEQAEIFYRTAIEHDPEYVSALRGLAWCEFLRARLGLKPPEEALPEVTRRMTEVWKRKPDDATTRSLHGAVLLMLTNADKTNYDKAVAEGQRAVNDIPGSADAHAVYAHTLTYVGEHDRALEQIELAMKLSPMYPPFYRWVRGRALRLAGRNNEAIAALRVGLSPDLPVIVQRVELAASYAAAGRYAEARAIARDIYNFKNDFHVREWLNAPRIRDDATYQQEFELLLKAGLPE